MSQRTGARDLLTRKGCTIDAPRQMIGVLGMWLLLSWLQPTFGTSQTARLFCHKVVASARFQFADSLVVEYASLIVSRSGTIPFLYRFDSLNNTLSFDSGPDSLLVCYRAIALGAGTRLSGRDTSLRTAPLKPGYARLQGPVRATADDGRPGILYSGSFSRGLSTGNNQSLVLHSKLNIQLAGDLGEGIRISGALSDDQIPIQPDGNTRQIQEFDRLFLKLTAKGQSLTAGDFSIRPTEGEFLQFFKKNKGASLDTRFEWNGWKLENQTAAAISRGKTHRLQLTTRHGNQGPYRLTGRDGERFIILLAGSERVWLDGNLLERGEQLDYTIDYNQAEIRFMPRQLVSEQTRVFVEFEYLDQNYTRSLFAHQAKAQKGPWTIYANLFSERDSRLPAVPEDLDSADLRMLALAGDDLALAVRTGVRSSGLDYDVNRVYYRQRDTQVVVQGLPTRYTYLVHDPYADSSALAVSFSEVAAGMGDYVLQQSNANGRVYAWSAPDPSTGAFRGNYRAEVRLIAPAAHLVANAGFSVPGRRDALLSAEFAASSRDQNRLSSLDDGDNSGFAAKLLTRSPELGFRANALRLQAEASYRFVHASFAPVQSFRPVEFVRDWNLAGAPAGAEHLPELTLRMNIQDRWKLIYSGSRYLRGSAYDGQRNLATLQFSDSLTNVSFTFNSLSAKQQDARTRFLRPVLEGSRRMGNGFELSLHAARERHERFAAGSDTLTAESFSFDRLDGRIRWQSRKGSRMELHGNYRSDLSPSGRQFSPELSSFEFGWLADLPNTRSGAWELRVSGRKLQYADPAVSDSLGSLFLLGSVDHRIQGWNQALRLRNFYALNSGSEPRQEFAFEERKPGEGDFIYVDFNQDGARQQFEYVYAPDIDTARYVRFQLFNSEYIQVHQASWNQVLQIDLREFGAEGCRLCRMLRPLSLESTVRFTTKLGEETAWESRLNPLYFAFRPERSIAYQSFVRQTLYFQRGHPVFEFQIGLDHSGHKVSLTSGAEERKSLRPHFRMRVRAFNTTDLTLDVEQQFESRTAQLSPDQDYRLFTRALQPGVLWQPSQHLRMEVRTGMRWVDDLLHGGEGSLLKTLSLETALSLSPGISLRWQTAYLHARYAGNTGELAAFHILQGFRNGDNFSWELQADARLSALITLQLGYNGRKAAQAASLHTGRMQLRANF
ncbi:MAG: hypothetical protein KBF37_03475 [Saprospiraceae bacterium]|nr:hypothetical protein [Saprospiraceae bacterium]